MRYHTHGTVLLLTSAKKSMKKEHEQGGHIHVNSQFKHSTSTIPLFDTV